MFFALSVGDLINGLSFVAAGVFRNLFMFRGQYFVEVTDMQCLFHTPWAILMLFAGQFPALINLFIALERAVALHFAGWYRRKWKDGYKLYLIVLSGSLTLIFLLVAIIINSIHVTTSTSRICAVMNSTGIVFGTVHYALIAVAYVFCFVVLAVIFSKTNKRKLGATFVSPLAILHSDIRSFVRYKQKQNEKLRIYCLICNKFDLILKSSIFGKLWFPRFRQKYSRKCAKPTNDELRRQRMMLAITGISVVLVSIPNLVLILNEWKAPTINVLVVGAAYCLYATHSTLSLFIYLIFRPDFRFRLLSAIGLARFKSIVGEPSRTQPSKFKSVATTMTTVG
ncbi:hypothetical protein RB195_019807 [Necator americanus]|uniref:G-protein coupled receptors family 1 profile domain-containing protein n=1 Tax=Necator americanus TaxID=51031 RepID=A0ABR1CFV3_NECAM